ncbi:MAG: serine/threonine-protein phosphatase [Bacteroidales bacterium]|jgi:serine phosphatase RsbU (regulator of sigma subunit)|nr:serine/threonine-protein phosphatase [Bacteroidales bacterium]
MNQPEEQIRLLESANHFLTAMLFVAVATIIVLFFLHFKNRRTRSLLMQKNNEIERHLRENDEITKILEQKRIEIDRQTLALNEATIELQWQTENALRLYDEVEQQKQEITDSIIYAKRIQTALLPDLSAVNEILNDYFILFKPRDIVSGDFYWVSAKHGKTVIVVADCTGHGVPGAFMSILGVSFLNEIINNHDLPVNEILDMLRDMVIKSLKQNFLLRDGMDLALCVIDWENSRVEYAGANIPLFILREPQNGEELVEIPANRMPVGLYENAMPFTRHVIPIMQGDALYMFSDGYCDQFGGNELKKFKKKNLKKLLLEIHHLSMNEQKHILGKNLQKWKGDLPQVDDILIMGIKI